LEKQIKSNNDLIGNLNVQASERAALNLKRQEKKKKETSLDSEIKSKMSDFGLIFGSQKKFQLDTLKKDLENILTEKVNAKKTLTNQIQKAKSEFSVLEGQLKNYHERKDSNEKNQKMKRTKLLKNMIQKAKEFLQ